MKPVWIGVVGAIALAGCAEERATRYAGAVSGCGPEMRGVMSIEHDAVLFTPDEGTWLLRGKIARDGAITASAVADTTAKVRREGSFAGQLRDGVVSGALILPGCVARVDLALARRGLSDALPPGSPAEQLLK